MPVIGSTVKWLVKIHLPAAIHATKSSCGKEVTFCQGGVAQVVNEGREGMIFGCFMRLSVVAWQKRGLGSCTSHCGAE